MQRFMQIAVLTFCCVMGAAMSAQTTQDLVDAIEDNFVITGMFGGGQSPPWILDPLATTANPSADFRLAVRLVHDAMMNAGGSGPVWAAWTLPVVGDPTVDLVWDVDNGNFSSSADELIVLLTGTSGSPTPLGATLTGSNVTAYVVGGDGSGSDDGSDVEINIDGSGTGDSLAIAIGGDALDTGDGGLAVIRVLRTTGFGTTAIALGGHAASGTGGVADVFNEHGPSVAGAGHADSGHGGEAFAISLSLQAFAVGGDGQSGGGDALADGFTGAFAAGGWVLNPFTSQSNAQGGHGTAVTVFGDAVAGGGNGNTGGNARATSTNNSARASGGHAVGPGTFAHNGGHAIAERLNTATGELAEAWGGDGAFSTDMGGDAEARRPGNIIESPAIDQNGAYAAS
jgi:hypothetical protein